MVSPGNEAVSLTLVFEATALRGHIDLPLRFSRWLRDSNRSRIASATVALPSRRASALLELLVTMVGLPARASITSSGHPCVYRAGWALTDLVG